MQELTVQINDEDAEFLEDKNINIENVVSRAINMRRQKWKDDNPIPTVPQSVLDRIEFIHQQCTSNEDSRLCSFREGIPRAKVSIGAMCKENRYEVSIHINRLQDIPHGEFNDKLSDCGEFLSEINKQITNKLNELNNLTYEFKLDKITENEFKKSAKYTVQVKI